MDEIYEFMEEIWLDIKNYEKLYQISNLGRVKSLKREVFNRRLNKNTPISEKILKIGLSGGYPTINLCKDGKCVNHHIHNLVAIYFIPNPENKKCVNHKDGVKTNCYSTNLEWATYSENSKHAFRTGLQKPTLTFGEDHGLSRLKKEQIVQIRKIYSEGNITQRKLATIFDVTQGTIGSIINRKTWKAII
jgi:hypothetical protein